MFRTCNSAALVAVIVCCLGLSASLFAIPNPACYRLNPKCISIPDRPGGVECPAGEKPRLLREDAPAYCTGGSSSTGRLSKEARAAVQDFLLARGEFPDGLTVEYGIKVSFKSKPSEQQVGKLFALTAQIKNKLGASMQGESCRSAGASGRAASHAGTDAVGG